jgi:hypothetical protein
LDQVIFFGEDSLRGAIHELVVHYWPQKNHGPRWADFDKLWML